MEIVKSYILQNWALMLVLLAFVIMLKITVFLEKKMVIRLYVLIASVFVLSIIVFAEFYLSEIGQYQDVRVIMMAIRYSASPVLVGFILYTLVKKARLYVLIPAGIFIILNIISIPTGIVFSLNELGELQRGPLGYLPYIAVGLYSAALVFVLIWQSNKQITEIIPIVFLAFALASGLVLPFVFGKDYSKIFCTTIAVALFVYYVFLILQLTKKDALTGLFNRQAYYAYIKHNRKDINAFISIDMNGLKAINDMEGHDAGDEALTTLANCFAKSTKIKQPVFRVGGDEFIIICRKTSKEELENIIVKIKSNVVETKYTCSIGYSHCADGLKTIEEMIKQSDEMMYADKASFYCDSGKDKRNR